MSDRKNTNNQIFSSTASKSKELTGISGEERDYISRFITSEMKVLHMNCGPGFVTQFLAFSCKEIVGVDTDAKAIAQAKLNFPEIEFHEMPAFSLDFEDDTFDAVIFTNCGLDFVYPESKRILVFSEVWKILKRGGTFIYSSHNRDSKMMTIGSILNILLNLITFQFLNDYWFEFEKWKIRLVWYGQIENELLTLRDLGFNIADMTDLDRKKQTNLYVARKR